MKVTLWRGLEPIAVLEDVTLVLVEGARGTPLAVASEYQPDAYTVKHAEEPDFNLTLRNLGLDRTEVRLERIPGPTLSEMGM